MKPIYLMHIAKTAGTTVNAFFVEHFGESNCITHLENPRANATFKDSRDRIQFASGHLYFDALYSLVNTDSVKFTILREPYSHIRSHLLWLDHYNQAEYDAEFRQLNADIQKVVRQIGETDLSDDFELDYLMNHLSQWGVKLLNNCQSRYLLGGGNHFNPITLKDFPIIQDHLNSLDFVGTTDNLKNTISKVLAAAGYEVQQVDFGSLLKRTNPKLSNRTIDINKPLTKAILQRHILVDIRLYNFCSKM